MNENKPGRPKKILLISDKGVRNLIDIDSVIRMEPRRRYTIVFIKDGHPIISWRHLKHYERELSTFGFVRVHRQHLINILELKSYKMTRGGTAVMNDDAKITISQGKKAVFLLAVESLTRRAS